MADERPSKARIKATRKQEKLAQQIRKEKTRRIFLVGSGVAGLGLSGLVAARFFGFPLGKPEVISDDSIFEAEYTRLGINKDQNEINLWKSENKPKSYPQKPDTYENKVEAAAKVNGAIQTMKKSANPFLKDAAETIDRLRAEGKLSVGIKSDLGAGDKGVNLMSTGHYVEGNDIKWEIQVSVGEILNLYDSLNIALKLAHETEHAKNLLKIDQENLHLTLEQRDLLQRRLGKTRQHVIEEEARGYAVEAQAYLYQFGLFRTRPKGTPEEELALRFIKAKNDPKGLEWADYISKNRINGLAAMN